MKHNDETLLMIEAMTHRAWVPENFQSFGTPRAAEERKQARRERLWRHVYRAGMVFVVLSVGIILGYNLRINATEVKRRAEVMQQMPYTRIAMLVPVDKRRCRMDWREGCLVCEHRALRGTAKSTMC